jgi:DNA-binding response OmpR family regulator
MSGKVIAIVDDEPHMVDMLSTFLQIKGYQTRGAYSGEEGVTLVQNENPDALLLDLMLPDIEGFEVCQRLRAIPTYATLPILIVTARTDPESRTRADKVGANAYLTKPVKFPELMAELERLFSAPPPPSPPSPVPPPPTLPPPPPPPGIPPPPAS